MRRKIKLLAITNRILDIPMVAMSLMPGMRSKPKPRRKWQLRKKCDATREELFAAGVRQQC